LEKTLQTQHEDLSNLLADKKEIISKFENNLINQAHYEESHELTKSLQFQLDNLQSKHEQDIASDKELIKTQFEKLTKEFECNKHALQSKIEQIEINETTMQEQYTTVVKEKTEIEIKLKDLVGHLEETSKADEVAITLLKNEIKESKDLIESLENEKINLHEEINILTKDIGMNVTDANDFTKLKDSEPELIELKKKLNLTLSNAKRLETEYFELDSLFIATEEEKRSLFETNIKLTKQIAGITEEVEGFHSEAEKAGTNPWEGEEWEGLTASEIYDIFKQDLVPAQQARLSKLCIEELEKKLKDNKSVLLRALQEKEELISSKNKLDAKICFLENSSSESLSETNQSTKSSSTFEDSKSSNLLIVPAKLTKMINSSSHELFSKEIVTEVELKTPASGRNLRRSSRSASKMPTISLLKTPTQDEVKRSANSIDKEEDAEKRIKVKSTDTESPAKTVKIIKKRGLIKPSKLSGQPTSEDRDPLGCVTNSPSKLNTPANTTETDLKENLTSSRGAYQQSTLRARNKSIQKTRNPEECKQQ